MKVGTAVMSAIAGVLLVAGVALLMALPVKWCWNYVMPYLFGLKTLSWGQAWCLTFLAGTLIKSTHAVEK